MREVMTRGRGFEDVEGTLRAKRDLPRAIVGEFGVGFEPSSVWSRALGGNWSTEGFWEIGDAVEC